MESYQHLKSSLSLGVCRVVCLETAAVLEHAPTIAAAAEFSFLMLWLFLADRTTLLPYAGKAYSRDVFLAIYLALVAVAFGSGVRKESRVMTLSRHQTEEWKGWMQVLFLLYHYFEAKEAYNAIRVFIAAYVWMTGYGNFHYYYKTGDYCVGRFAQMMWRLNFLVAFCCIVFDNSYMLYYICPMHTFFTVLVYAALGLGSQLNASSTGIAVKFAASVALVVALWESDAVFYAMWRPFAWLVGYIDPRRAAANTADTDVLHEWYFRSGLDRYVWIYGMLLAWLHPCMESAWKAIEGLKPAARFAVRAALLATVAVIGHQWYVRVYLLPKVEYNAMHPYTSWIPITLWIVVRNFLPEFRSHSLGFFGWLGCITLETYISQFHTWLRSNIPDGQPKWLLVLVPEYPLVNFLLVSFLYVFISYRFFHITNTLKTAFVPHSDNAKLARNCVVMAVSACFMYALGIVFHSFVYMYAA